MNFFSDKETVDDLGIGSIRDAISNLLFPGTSVIQTRARYFLFVPWIYGKAEKKFPKQLLARAGAWEKELIQSLLAGGDLTGLIGREKKNDLKILPSTIFWSGLNRFGVFLPPQLTIRQYGKHASKGRDSSEAEGEMGERSPSFWHRDIPDPPEGFFDFKYANFDLTLNEAEWLCERILSSDEKGQPSSLLSGYIRDLLRGLAPAVAEAMWDEELPRDSDPRMINLVRHAKQFSCATNGASLLYNLMLAEDFANLDKDPTNQQSVEYYQDRLAEWAEIAREINLADWAAHIGDFWECLFDEHVKVPLRTQAFINRFSAELANSPTLLEASKSARTIIRSRENEHKGLQARLNSSNKKRLREWNGDSGTRPLLYRWPQVQRLLIDIDRGLKGETFKGTHVID